MAKITTVGIDLAKNVFSVHGIDEAGRVALRKTVRRDRLLELVSHLQPCIIGLKACGGSHEWARRFQTFGHTVRIMAAQFVAPYRRKGKNDRNDAEAICEAVQRPSMRFVPNQERRAAGRSQLAPRPPGIRRGAHRHDQSNPRPPRRVWRHSRQSRG